MGAATALLAVLHILLWPMFSNRNTLERTILTGTAVMKMIWLFIMFAETSGGMDITSASRAIRFSYLAMYLHDTLSLLVKRNELLPLFWSSLLTHHILGLMLLWPYLAIWGSNADVIHVRCLAIWSLKDLVADVLELYRLSHGTPAWWDTARLAKLLGLLVPVLAAYVYGSINMHLSVLGYSGPTIYLMTVGLLLPACSLYQQYVGWAVRRRYISAQHVAEGAIVGAALAGKAQRSDTVVAAARAVDLVMVVEMDTPLPVSTGAGSFGGYARFSKAERADSDQLQAGGDNIAASHR